MATIFQMKGSYENQAEYSVFGHSSVRRIVAYSEDALVLEYQRKYFNGSAEEFERNMVARQGGVAIIGTYKPLSVNPHEYRWPQEFYLVFVQWLKYKRAAYQVEHERRRVERGWTIEEFPFVERSPIPRPIFFNHETKCFETEPWFLPEMAQWEPESRLVAA